MELIIDNGFEAGSGSDFGPAWVVGNDRDERYPPRRQVGEEDRGFAALIDNAYQYIEQTLYTPMYATGDLNLRIGRMYEVFYAFELEVSLYYEGRYNPDVTSLYRPSLPGRSGDPQYIWEDHSIPTRRCSKLTKIRIECVAENHGCKVDDVSIEGSSDYSWDCGFPEYQPIPSSWYRPPGKAPLPPGVKPLPGPALAQIPISAGESILSDIEYRLRSIENQLQDLKVLEIQKYRAQNPVFEQKHKNMERPKS